ncbi:PREDICTED: GDNF family receptor alpha-1-like [Tauraco erythrolophus]|uniref:GDNF family receptor alpha-1-like n=1 Tax=Tauraco erythrolophus TaxID=121530 RepID=UPI000523A3F3|nr:PREDICTED: GDNF family receptor alpha-1-like [Tauraco erythrolophus]
MAKRVEWAMKFEIYRTEKDSGTVNSNGKEVRIGRKDKKFNFQEALTSKLCVREAGKEFIVLEGAAQVHCNTGVSSGAAMGAADETGASVALLCRTQLEPVLSKGNNCLDAAKACNLNDTCKRFRSAYITPCTSSTSNEICNKRKCHKALRLFFDKVPPKHSYGMLFCSCRDVACTERRRQTIVPVCSYEDREKPNCLNLQESCKKNYICRSRLADFFTNCQPESRSVSSCLKENYADCLLAYSGLIGTVMTPNYIDSNSLSVAPWCDCSNSGNDIDECLKFLNFFQDNICLKNAIQAFGNGTDVNVWQPILPVQTTTATTTTASRLKNAGSETTNNEIPTHNDSPACANLQAQKKRKSNESVDTELCLNENAIGKDNTAGVSTSHISSENSLALPTSFYLSTSLTLMTLALSICLFLSSSVVL